MAHKYCFKALDKSLQDIPIVCGGNFRQIFLVIPKGTRPDIVNTSLNSFLWPLFKVYEVNQKMRLRAKSIYELEVVKIAMFDNWMLQIGDGSFYDHPHNKLLQIPHDIYV
ncbi:hypothetical protein OSB04_000735 [Centaurea solstitialis]|uniref:ATP-dependent DNA helicase n=1 Tax=Centaurea solstitialis TaxID=347529 RepID=A0AA38WU08_9ASTR|nr:hypothetical protein OSB04_000735 [Centaurea solstitialis]